MAQTKIRGSKQFFADDNVDFNSKKITGLGTPTLSTDAATKAYVDQILGANNAMVYKGAIDCSTNPNYPAADAGETYVVSVSGKIGGVSGVSVVAGDLFMCKTDSTASGDQATVGAQWDVVHVAGASGTVISTAATPLDNQIVRLDGTTGTTVQNSLAIIDDNGSINIPTGESYKINGVALNQDNIPDGSTNKAYTATEQTKLAGIEATADVTDAVNVGSSIFGATAKTSLVDADTVPLTDSAASNVLKKITWANLKLAIKSYADTLYNLYVHPNHSGDVTSVADGATTIAAGVVTLAKMANLAQNAIIGRITTGTGVPEALTAANVRTIINVADGATANAKATGAEINTGTDDVKFATPLAIAGSTIVKGPASAVDSRIAAFDGTSGKLLKDGGATIASLVAETTTTIGTLINGATEKTTPVDADMVGLMDSAASNILKKLSWTNIKATLKTYFDGIYNTKANYIVRETPSGLLNGSNVTFTLANTPVSGMEMVFLNGILQNAGATEDYTISTNTITMGVAPVSTDVILVTYWK